jgi:undecaprenyl-phosphate 4-deoxy-4-formamido-L-arabinose transferase
MQSGISVIIPVYRSQGSVALVIKNLLAVLPTVAPAYEIILVEDGSPDDVWGVLVEQSAKHPQVRALRLMRNFGQHNALLCGVIHAQYDLCVTMDDDLQHPPDELHKLVAALGRYDVLYGYPDEAQYGGFMRRIATYVTKRVLQEAMGKDNARFIAPYRVFRTQLREAFKHYSGNYVNIDVLLTWGTSKFHHIPVHYQKRTIGTSSYTLSKLITHTVNLLVGFSTLPLRIASLLGLALTGFGFVVMFYILVVRFFVFGAYEVPGFTFLASVISIFAGAQLFILGIMGEYIARIYFRVMERPVFVVAQDTRPD